MSRRALIASLAGGAIIAACGGDGGTAGPVSCTEHGTTVDISQNHGHVLMVTIDEVLAGVEKTYDIMGTSLHTHAVTITADQFAMLLANQSITAVTTVTSSHTHTIVVMCA